ncbi:manganese efflux pump MntP family protein [Pontibacillus yanchengensis]|uniref:Putative manganese efflux pump MntP n=1 Tax=Pontibacillus yanchengensis Y32 TaxID=1385514 RepID=A0A0A2T863_9BACI|nr:manganese efflux pump MntP family protein [Pontibacillus yanchengensis]KGP71982.1 membrane protein [Pontibacillus yanchengensis Y32]
MGSIPFVGEMITLSLMALALGMDAFSVGLGMGMIPLRLRRIAIIGFTVGMFHIIMPFSGMVLGRFLSNQLGSFTTMGGGALLIILGVQMFRSSFKKDDEPALSPIGFGLIVFALSVSLDSFSVGLSLGMFGVRTVMTLLLFGIASMVLTWIGLLLGRKVQGLLGTYSEMLGGSILCGFGLQLIFG